MVIDKGASENAEAPNKRHYFFIKKNVELLVYNSLLQLTNPPMKCMNSYTN